MPVVTDYILIKSLSTIIWEKRIINRLLTTETEDSKSTAEVLVTEILSKPLSLAPVVLIRNKDSPGGHPEDNTQPTYDIQLRHLGPKR